VYISQQSKSYSFRQREKMIASDIVMEIRQMLAQGSISQRAIAQRMGVSRGTVWAIAQGKRRDRPRIIQGNSQFIAPAGRAVRCCGCGGMVQMPCLACYIRRWQSKQRNGRTGFVDNGLQNRKRFRGDRVTD
jgi:hypothetical protein